MDNRLHSLKAQHGQKTREQRDAKVKQTIRRLMRQKKFHERVHR